jgi:hypothetical protein
MQLLKVGAVVTCIAWATLATPDVVVAGPFLHSESFDDPTWVANQPNNWQNFGGATITRALSGTGGITSQSGPAHATLTTGNGPFTRFGGYRNSFGPGFSASQSIYLDPSWLSNTGFDYSVAASKQDGSHLRDFIWHVGSLDGTSLLVNASNNTDSVFNAWKLQNENAGHNFEVNNAGWNTFENVFYDMNGNLAVDYNLYSDNGQLLYTVTRATNDTIAIDVGGNRYGWFTYNSISGLAIDSTALRQLPEPSSVALWGLMLSAMIAWGYRCRKSINPRW